jgi:hypothetical protein
LCSREETREAIVETLNEVGWRYSMRGVDTYAAETDWTEGLGRVVLITLREDDAVVVSNLNAYMSSGPRDRADVDTFLNRFRLCVSRKMTQPQFTKGE